MKASKSYGSDVCPICCGDNTLKQPATNAYDSRLISESCIWCWGPKVINTRVVPFPSCVLIKGVVVSDVELLGHRRLMT